MKKKIVIKISTCCDKCRTKAMQTAAVADGVNTVALEGGEKDKLVVTGERIDAACLTKTVRKKISYAELVTVEEVKPEEPKKPTPAPAPAPTQLSPPPPCCHGGQPPRCELVGVAVGSDSSTCTIM